MSFRKSVKIGKNNSSPIENTKSDVKISENVLKARKAHTSLSLLMYVCLIIGILKPLFVLAALGIVLYMFFNKNAKQRMYVSNAAYNLQFLKLEKARENLEKARNVLNNELVKELEKNILVAEKRIMNK